MASVNQNEIRAGLVVHLDVDLIRQEGGAETNAGSGRAVEGAHYFLVLDVVAETCTAVPLFSGPARGNVQLREDLKGGMSDKWIGQNTYYSPFQHWKIPVKSVVAASQSEESQSSDRRTYAEGDTQELAKILDSQARNTNSYRPL